MKQIICMEGNFKKESNDVEDLEYIDSQILKLNSLKEKLLKEKDKNYKNMHSLYVNKMELENKQKFLMRDLDRMNSNELNEASMMISLPLLLYCVAGFFLLGPIGFLAPLVFTLIVYTGFSLIKEYKLKEKLTEKEKNSDEISKIENEYNTISKQYDSTMKKLEENQNKINELTNQKNTNKLSSKNQDDNTTQLYHQHKVKNLLCNEKDN